MASVKKLKQNINYITGELFSECLFCRLYIPGVDPVKADEVLTSILKFQDEFLKRSNHPDGTKNSALVKSYYKKLAVDIKKQVDEIIQHIQSLNK